MKAAGAALIIAACTWYGVIKAARLKTRAGCLGAFLECLRLIEAELISTAPPLPELFSHLEKTARPAVRSFFGRMAREMDELGDRGVSQLWSEALEAELPALTSYQRSELSRPGAALGRYDYAEQAAAIEGCLARMESELQRAEQKAREGLRLYTGLGLAGGIMAAAVML